ncbi:MULTISPECIES: rRNA maturation RNase YbeY [Polaribacter]|jgi:rRNA maturation RNase YbeY|uniref:Endoribonuclease YbeY n=1 Tax=Polaribacter sejongensis TaxID=985043 RepID=A0ABM6PXS2_9FLAO|nr:MULTISPECIES: rRNA maturation RNase YbeY [Polaribacter]AUC21592.1 rRNA maturation RNase YbeY [Polaribacter sejongensis]QXP66278.1 rRNA maturation RNase YbeY [Polaribacter sp. AHE13PA]QXP71771.1 rRNA maturation RNase YbeY [Polaribacter sp. R2A056_3_33]
MVTFNYETDFDLKDENLLEYWIDNVVSKKGFSLGELNYIFCDDEYLHKLNVEFLQHDTLTDVISFDNTLGKLISGDIYISIERVADNAKDFEVSFIEELHRVMIHGVLHYMGYKDKTETEKKEMRNAENTALSEFK